MHYWCIYVQKIQVRTAVLRGHWGEEVLKKMASPIQNRVFRPEIETGKENKGTF